MKSNNIMNYIFCRENIINAARQLYPNIKLGDQATMVGVRDGYWVGVSLYVSKKDIINSSIKT